MKMRLKSRLELLLPGAYMSQVNILIDWAKRPPKPGQALLWAVSAFAIAAGAYFLAA